MNNLDHIRELLKADGYTQHFDHLFSHDPREYWCKRVKDARACELNYDKDGIQVVVWLYEIKHSQVTHRSVEVEVSGEYQDHWYRFIASCSPDPFAIGRKDIIARLLRAWEGLSQVIPSVG